MAPEKVWVGRLTERDQEQSVETALAKVAIDAIAPRADLVVIKINLCDYRTADSGATTDPELLRALLRRLRARYPGSTQVVLENDATTMDVPTAFKLLGFEELARQEGACLMNAATAPWTRKAVPGGAILKDLEVPGVLDQCDLFVNLAKMKTNALTKVTGCLKNVFALLKQKNKVVLHGVIDEVLQDMNKVIRPHLCLVDGLVGMEGLGPAFGVPRRCGLLLAARNPVAVDSCMASLMGFSPRSVRHIRLCEEAGIGPTTYEMETNIPGFDPRDYRFAFDRLEYHLRRALRRRLGMAL